MNFILFDDNARIGLLPLTFTRPVADIRIGILTIREKWEKMLGAKTSTKTEAYLGKKYPAIFKDYTDNVWVNGSVCPNEELAGEIKNLKPGQQLLSSDLLLAINTGNSTFFQADKTNDFEGCQSQARFLHIKNTWDIFSKNEMALKADFKLLTAGRKTGQLSATNQLINAEDIFIEEGVKAECVILNASSGPVYIGKDAEIMEGSIIRGPFSLGEHATLKLGTKIYGATTIGPHCKVGGEVNNSVIFGYTNKAHDGFLGNSVIGEWCNLGADTNNSNLKNNYGEVKLWSYENKTYCPTGLTFCGLIMGDHSKCGINTMFNTGTVVGVNANIFGSDFPPTYIPSFSWGGAAGFSTYKIKNAIEVAARVFSRRGLSFDDNEKEILTHLSGIQN